MLESSVLAVEVESDAINNDTYLQPESWMDHFQKLRFNQQTLR